MILDARQIQDGADLGADVLIVGTGAAGLSLALALDRKGVSTLLVEAGGDGLDKAGQDFYRAATIAPDDHGPVHMYRRRAFGGTTAVWGGRCIPFDPIDFEDRPWMPHAEWPIGYEDAAAYIPAAMETCRAGAAAFDAEPVLGAGPMVDGFSDPDVLTDRIERFSEPTHFGKAYRAILDRSATTRILMHASVTEVVANAEGSAVTGVVVRTPEGRVHEIRARRVVVAAGGLETPRVLLASRGARSRGLGDDNGLVGRFYQSHLEGDVGEITFSGKPKDVRLNYEKSADGIYCRRYMWLSPEAQRRERLSGMILRPNHASIVDPGHGHPVLSAMYLVKDTIVPEYSRKMTMSEQSVRARYAGGNAAFYGAHVGNIVMGGLTLAPFAVDWFLKRNLATRKMPSVVLRDRRNQYVLDINAEQCPNPESRVFLSDERDANGVPRLAIDWRTTGQDHDMLFRGVKLMRDGLVRGGAGAVDLGDDEELRDRVRRCTRVGGHHIGTARMGRTAKSGVVDGDCQVFGVAGLYVAGAAVFPTSGFANPTLMIVALSLRLADHLAARA